MRIEKGSSMEEINFSEFLKYFWNYIWIATITTLLGILVSWFYISYVQVPVYQSQTSIVLTRSEGSNSITQSDINLNKNLVSTYREIIKSRRILTEVINKLNLKDTVSSLSNRINVTSANETELIVISVTDEDSEVACDIANQIAEVFRKEITSIYNIENISIVDEAIEASAPSNVNIPRQYMLGIIGGFVLGTLIIVLFYCFDDTVNTIDDIDDLIFLNQNHHISLKYYMLHEKS